MYKSLVSGCTWREIRLAQLQRSSCVGTLNDDDVHSSRSPPPLPFLLLDKCARSFHKSNKTGRLLPVLAGCCYRARLQSAFNQRLVHFFPRVLSRYLLSSFFFFFWGRDRIPRCTRFNFGSRYFIDNALHRDRDFFCPSLNVLESTREYSRYYTFQRSPFESIRGHASNTRCNRWPVSSRSSRKRCQKKKKKKKKGTSDSIARSSSQIASEINRGND